MRIGLVAAAPRLDAAGDAIGALAEAEGEGYEASWLTSPASAGDTGACSSRSSGRCLQTHLLQVQEMSILHNPSIRVYPF